MHDSLKTYVQDHLAGAEFALALLSDISKQTLDQSASQLAGELLPEIDADKAALNSFANGLGTELGPIKQAMAMLGQKVSTPKLDVSERLGLFEAVELLMLGVLGKRALWQTLQTIREHGLTLPPLELAALQRRAEEQHASLENLRCQLAAKTFLSESLP